MGYALPKWLNKRGDALGPQNAGSGFVNGCSPGGTREQDMSDNHEGNGGATKPQKNRKVLFMTAIKLGELRKTRF